MYLIASRHGVMLKILYVDGVSTPEEERRIKICEGCEWFRKDQDPEFDTPTVRSCKLCGCPVDSKAIEPLESCPIKKWEQHFESFKVTTYADIKRKLNQD